MEARCSAIISLSAMVFPFLFGKGFHGGAIVPKGCVFGSGISLPFWRGFH